MATEIAEPGSVLRSRAPDADLHKPFQAGVACGLREKGWGGNALVRKGIALCQAGSSITCPLRFLTPGRSDIFACHADKAEQSSGIEMPAAPACMSAA